MRYEITVKAFRLFLPKADSLSIGTFISGRHSHGRVKKETHSTARVSLCSKLA